MDELIVGVVFETPVWYSSRRKGFVHVEYWRLHLEGWSVFSSSVFLLLGIYLLSQCTVRIHVKLQGQ